MRIAIGMDLHARSAVCYAVYAGNGEPNARQKEFLDGFNREHRVQASGPEDMAAIADYLKGHEAYVLVENSTKTYETYWVLTNLGVNTVVAQAQDLYRITRSVRKTDKNDSVELAGYMRRYLFGEREFAVCTMPPKEWMAKRELCRVLFSENRHLSNLKRRLRAHLLLHGTVLERTYSDIFSKGAVAELRRMNDPCVRLIVGEAVDLKKRVAEEKRLIEHLMSGDRTYGLILSIPGFGPVSAAYLTSLIIDIDRFRNRNAFTAYFGIVPKMRESADISHNCATTHRGDDDARLLLMQTALVHHMRVPDSVVSCMWDRMKAKGKPTREIQVACARKLLTVVWSVLKTGEEYLKRSSDRSSDEDADDFSELEQERGIR